MLLNWSNGGENHTVVRIQQKRPLTESFKWWAEVDSNHRTLAGTDLQSVAFSHSATYPYLIFNKFALDEIWTRGLSLTKGVRYPCATRASLTLSLNIPLSKKKAGNRNRTYNLRFTKPLLYRWAIPATWLMILKTNFIVNIYFLFYPYILFLNYKICLYY